MHVILAFDNGCNVSNFIGNEIWCLPFHVQMWSPQEINWVNLFSGMSAAEPLGIIYLGSLNIL